MIYLQFVTGLHNKGVPGRFFINEIKKKIIRLIYQNIEIRHFDILCDRSCMLQQLSLISLLIYCFSNQRNVH